MPTWNTLLTSSRPLAEAVRTGLMRPPQDESGPAAALHLLSLDGPLCGAVVTAPAALDAELTTAADLLERARGAFETVPAGALIDLLGVQLALLSAGVLTIPCLPWHASLDRLARSPRDLRGYELRVAFFALAAGRPAIAWQVLGEEARPSNTSGLGPGALGAARFVAMLDLAGDPSVDLRPTWRSFVRLFPRRFGGMLGWPDLLAVAHAIHVRFGGLTPDAVPAKVRRDARALSPCVHPAA